MNHLSEEQFVDAFYHDLSPTLAAHLAACHECRARARQWSDLLGNLREYPVPERGAEYGGEVWARLAPSITRPLPKKHDWKGARGARVASAWKWAWLSVPALAALLALAFFGGIWTERKHHAQTPDRSRERVLLISMSDHLERSQIVLAELIHATPGESDLAQEQKRARALLAENRLLRQTALNLGDRTHAALLDDLERILLDLANETKPAQGDELRDLQKRVEDDGLLWKVRMTSRNAREKGQNL